MSRNFVRFRFQEILFQTDAESFVLENKKVLFLKKYSLGHFQYQNKKALFTDPIFIDSFGFN